MPVVTTPTKNHPSNRASFAWTARTHLSLSSCMSPASPTLTPVHWPKSDINPRHGVSRGRADATTCWPSSRPPVSKLWTGSTQDRPTRAPRTRTTRCTRHAWPRQRPSGASGTRNNRWIICERAEHDEDMRPIDQQTILITGATDGLGRALAARLAAEGATVLVHGRDDQRGKATLQEI